MSDKPKGQPMQAIHFTIAEDPAQAGKALVTMHYRPQVGQPVGLVESLAMDVCSMVRSHPSVGCVEISSEVRLYAWRDADPLREKMTTAEWIAENTTITRAEFVEHIKQNAANRRMQTPPRTQGH